MDRRGFLKVVGLGGLAIAAAPALTLPDIKPLAVAEPERRFFLPPATGWPRGNLVIEPTGSTWGSDGAMFTPWQTTYTIEGYYDPSLDQLLTTRSMPHVTLVDQSGMSAKVMLTAMDINVLPDDAIRMKATFEGLPGEPLARIKRGALVAGLIADRVTIDRSRERLFRFRDY